MLCLQDPCHAKAKFSTDPRKLATYVFSLLIACCWVKVINKEVFFLYFRQQFTSFMTYFLLLFNTFTMLHWLEIIDKRSKLEQPSCLSHRQHLFTMPPQYPVFFLRMINDFVHMHQMGWKGSAENTKKWIWFNFPSSFEGHKSPYQRTVPGPTPRDQLFLFKLLSEGFYILTDTSPFQQGTNWSKNHQQWTALC